MCESQKTQSIFMGTVKTDQTVWIGMLIYFFFADYMDVKADRSLPKTLIIYEPTHDKTNKMTMRSVGS